MKREKLPGDHVISMYFSWTCLVDLVCCVCAFLCVSVYAHAPPCAIPLITIQSVQSVQ